MATTPKADHWTELGLAGQWARAGELLSVQDPLASAAAWAHAADHYQAYHDAWQEHLPASRWDYDYGPELSEALTRGRGPKLVPPEPAARAPFVDHALHGRFDEAAACVTQRPTRRGERAILSILATHSGREGRAEEEQRLRAWARETPLSDLGASLARGACAATGEPLSHLDYPPRSEEVACVTIGIEREGLWRGVALLVERGLLRAAYVPHVPGAEGLVHVLPLDDDDTAPVASALTTYLVALGPRSPALGLVNVVCDGLQVLCGSLEVPEGRWLPRFAPDACAASLDLDGPAWVAWPDLVKLTQGAAGVVLAIEPGYGASGLSVEVASPAQLVAASPALVALVRAVVNGRAIARAARRG